MIQMVPMNSSLLEVLFGLQINPSISHIHIVHGNSAERSVPK